MQARIVARRGAALALLVALPLLVGAGEGAETPQPLAADSDPQVVRVMGPVEVGTGLPPRFQQATPGMSLAPGDQVRTGAGGRVEIALDGQTVRLYENSLLRLPDRFDASEREVDLDRGRSLFDVLRGRSVPFRVRTPEVVVSVKGTRFLVDAESGGGVSVFRGLVEVASALEALPGTEPLLVREGFAAVGGGGAPLELLMQDAPDPWDDFVDGGAAPALPGSETLESARSVLEQAIVDEIGTLDPDLVAPTPGPAAVESAAVSPQAGAADVADRPARDRDQLPAALDRLGDGADLGPDLAVLERTALAQPGDGALSRVALEERVGALEARLSELALTPTLDPVVDVARSGGSGAGTLVASVRRTGGAGGSRTGSSGGVGGLPIATQLLNGGEQVLVELGGTSVVLDTDDLDDIDSDDLGPLLDVLIQLGVDPDDVGGLLGGLF